MLIRKASLHHLPVLLWSEVSVQVVADSLQDLPKAVLIQARAACTNALHGTLAKHNLQQQHSSICVAR